MSKLAWFEMWYTTQVQREIEKTKQYPLFDFSLHCDGSGTAFVKYAPHHYHYIRIYHSDMKRTVEDQAKFIINEIETHFKEILL